MKTGRIHSSLQAMLISPEPKGLPGGYKGADGVFAAQRTPVTQFVHSADELLEAQFPVHPALFTDMRDKELEMTRREQVGQCEKNGWVDSDVNCSTPTPGEQGERIGGTNGLNAGMDVYALDCEMVVTSDDVFSLARVSLLDWNGKVVMNTFVRPALPIKHYHTEYSGITKELLEGVETTLPDIQEQLLKLLTPSAIIVGHSLESDFNALKMTHPFVVDTSVIYPHPRGLPLRSSLKYLSNKYLKREIQKGGAKGHDSVEDAKAALDLVKLKCEKGPRWGTMDANGESIFARLNASRCRTAIIEHGTPERGLGRLASIQIGCQNDEEVAEAVVKAVRNQVPEEKVNFVFSRLRGGSATGSDENRDLTEAPSHEVRPRNPNGNIAEHENLNGSAEHPVVEVHSQANDSLADVTSSDGIVNNLKRIYNGLAPGTVFVAFSGVGDMTEVNRLQDMQTQYRKEFKVKKWDELSVKWTDDEVQALRKATAEARKGWAIACLK
jgi:RNA exonuclease 1